MSLSTGEGMDKELIYSADYEKPEMRIPQTEQSEEERRLLSQQFQELLRKSEQESVFVVWPGKEEKANKLIELAKVYSQASETDIKIFRALGEVTVWLYHTSGFMAGEIKNALSLLMQIADEVDIIPHPKNTPAWCDYVIVLTIFTHRHFVAGSDITKYY